MLKLSLLKVSKNTPFLCVALNANELLQRAGFQECVSSCNFLTQT